MLVDEFRTGAAAYAHLASDMPTVARRMDEMRAGYPSRTVGASMTSGEGFSVIDDRPPDPNGDVHLTRVERDATTVDRVECDTLELREIIVQMAALARRADRICQHYRLTPTSSRAQALTEAPKDWCTSCYRDNQHHEPVSVDGRGRVRYEGLCRWCGDFHKAHGVLPSRKLLEHRHAGRRITEPMVQADFRRGKR